MESEVASVIDVAAVAVTDNPALEVSQPVAVLNVKAELAVFDPVKLALAELATVIGSTQYDINTGAGEKVARELRGQCVTLRTRTEALYKTRNAPLLEAQRQMRAVKAEIEAGIAPHEAKLDKAITDKEAAKEVERQARLAAEAARVDALRARITAVAALPAKAALLDSSGILDLIGPLQLLDASSFEEFEDEFEGLAIDIESQLCQMMQAAAGREQQVKDLAAREAKLQAQREEDARIAVLRQQIADIKAWPLKALSMNAARTANYLDDLLLTSLAVFSGELHQEAIDARAEAINQLNGMVEVKSLAEAEAERQVEAAQVAADERARADAEAHQRQLDAEAASARAGRLFKEQQDAFDAERQEALAQQEAERKAIAQDRAKLVKENKDAQDERDRVAAEQAEQVRLDAQAVIDAAAAIKAASSPLPVVEPVVPTPAPWEEKRVSERPDDLAIAKLVAAHYNTPIETAISWLSTFNAFTVRGVIAARLIEEMV